ncbi:MAG: hypothetical protein PHE84_08690 [bacterium]|nr:hypothetical protein [bacterium]
MPGLEFSLDELGVEIIFDPAGFREIPPDISFSSRPATSRKAREKAVLRFSRLSPDQDPFPLIPGQDLPIKVEREGNRLIFRSSGSRAEYDLKTRQGEIRAVPDRLSGSLENFLRVIYSYFLLERGGVLLHAFGFAWKGSAHILFGPSGSGKSTAAGLSSGISAGGNQVTILSDDVLQVIAGGRNGDFLVSRPPLETRLPSCDQRWPAKSAFLLVKNHRHLIVPSEPAVSLSRLLANVLYVSEDPETIPELLGLLEKFARACPVGELHFRPDPGFFKLII